MIPPSFTAHRYAIVDTLNDAGIKAVGDPRLQPPGVLVDGPDFDQPVGNEMAVRYTIHVIAAPPGDAEALDWINDTAAQVVAALGYFNLSGFAGTYPLGDADCPCKTITFAATADLC